MTLSSRLASCALLLLISARLADFWGLHYGNTDDISTDYMRMVLPLSTIIKNYAASQSRIQFAISAPLWTAVMSLAGTPWYDLVNLGMFSLSILLPVFALSRYFLPGTSFLLYATALFAPLPFLFSYSPPYCYPLWMSFPITCCGVAVLLFQHAAHHRWYLIPAFLATFLSLCAYESATIVSIAILSAYFIASSEENRPYLRRKDLQCAAAALVCFVCLYFPYRVLHPPQYQGVQASAKYLTPASIARVVGTLSLTSSIYAWLALPQKAQSIDPPNGVVTIQATLLPQRASKAGIALALLTTALAFFLISEIQPIQAAPVKLAALTLLLLIAPNLAYPLTEKIAAPVVNHQMYAYTATAYSQVGLACALVALAMASTRIRLAPLRIFIAAALSVFLGVGSLAASTFNRESAVFARQQASRWKVIRNLAGCANHLPAAVLQNLAAPRLWQSATANLSWGDPAQEASYWDVLAFDRYGLRTHLIAQPTPSPDVNWLDFHLAPNGALQSIVIARSIAGKSAPESWTITATPDPPATACTTNGLHISHRAADPSVTPPPAAATQTEPADAPVLTPSSGGGMEQVFTLTLSPRDNGVDVRTAGLLINGVELGMDSCYVFWDLLTHEQRLVNDSGEDSTVMSSGGLLQNRHCDFLTSQYARDGEALTLTYHVRFHSNFRGLKQIYLFRKNTAGGNTGLKHLGNWWARD